MYMQPSTLTVSMSALKPPKIIMSIQSKILSVGLKKNESNKMMAVTDSYLI